MARRRHRNSDYKFSEHETSMPGIISVAAALVALVLVVVSLRFSLAASGEAGTIVGVLGAFSFLLVVMGIILAVMGLREEDTYKFFPKLGMALNVLGAIVFVAIIVIGNFL